MRVLMSGGIKTQNIVNAIAKKFKASGDEFIIVEYLEDINSIYSRGDYFDKAIIAEQSINRDGAVVDEYEIRQRLNNFVQDSVNRNKKVSFVFFTGSEDMANMIHEEILPIISHSAVVVKQQPYFANFFTSLIVNDIGQLPSELVFKPQNISANIDENMEASEDPLADIDLDVDMTIPTADTSPGEELFGNPSFGDDTQIQGLGDEMPIDEEFMPSDGTESDYDMNEFTPDEDGGEFNNPDDIFNNAGDADIVDNQNQDWGNMGEDSVIDTDDAWLGERSDALPDYEVPNMPVEDNYQFGNNDGFLQGFDTEEDTDEDIYGDAPTTDIYKPNGGNDYSGEIPVNQDDTFDPLGQQLYVDNTQTQEQNWNPDDMYNDQQQQYTQEEPMNQTEPDNYTGYDQQSQYNQDPYGQNQYGNDYGLDVEATQTPSMNNPIRQIGKKRKGISGLLGGNRVASEPMEMGNQPIGTKDLRKVKDALKPFAARGNSIVVTGCGGCGTSTVAFNLANIICQIGYTVLLVDMDTEGKSQSYISKACYDSMDVDGSNLMSAVNSSTNMNSNATVVKKGFHLLTMGLGTDILPIEEQLHKEKIARFVSVVKTGYNFIIYDVPFKHSVGFLSDITFMCDNLALVVDASNWGVTKTMLEVCNIDSDDMQDTIFHRAQLVFNKYRNLNKLFGLRVKTCDDIVRAMDKKVLDLTGDDVGLQFSRMSIAGILNDDPMYENGWYDDIQYSDTKKGQDTYIDLIESIVLKKH